MYNAKFVGITNYFRTFAYLVNLVNFSLILIC